MEIIVQILQVARRIMRIVFGARQHVNYMELFYFDSGFEIINESDFIQTFEVL